MGRGRSNAREEAHREAIEGDLFALGNARVYTLMVMERVGMAADSYRGAQELLGPVLQDMDRIDTLIRNVQARMKSRLRQELERG